MAKSTTGKWVSRVAASGGSKAYKKKRPTNYYGVLALIVVLGLLVTLYSRYEYQNPLRAKAAAAPAIGTTWYAGLGIEDCGTLLPSLPADAGQKGGFHVLTNNVIKISPTSPADAGANDTLAQFAAEYTGLIATSNNLGVPTSTGAVNPATTYKTGQTCATGTKYAGQKGVVEYAVWKTFGQKTPTITTDPTSIHLTNYMRVTMAFVPKGVTPLPPAAATSTSMVQIATTPTTTTTIPTLTTTTVTSGSTTTTLPPTTTTTKSTTTTAG